MTPQYKHFRTLLAGLVLPLAAFTVAEKPATATDFPVSIMASAGSVKKCVTRPDNGNGWVLGTCIASPNQTFDYASNGGLMKLTTSNDCVGVLTSQAASLKAGATVTRIDCGTKSGALLNWKNQFTATTAAIVLVGSPNNSLCMTGDLSGGAGLTLGDCSQVAAAMKFVNFTRFLAFHVRDSAGKDTGNCLANPSTGILWTIQPCNRSSAAQYFMFDTSGMGEPIAAVNATNTAFDCIGAPASWNVGAPVQRQAACWLFPGRPASVQAPTKWRWTQGSQIVGVGSPNQSRCLTLDSSKGPGLFVGDCAQPATLTKWEVTFTQF